MINWKLRFQNKTTLISLLVAVVAFIYQILGIFEITPKVSEDEVTQLVMMIINVLAAVGIVVDPTTKGISDSKLALTRENIKETWADND